MKRASGFFQNILGPVGKGKFITNLAANLMMMSYLSSLNEYVYMIHYP